VLTRERHPTIQSRSPLFTASAGRNSYRPGGALYDVSQTDFFLDEKARKTNPMDKAEAVFVGILGCLIFPFRISATHAGVN
jgi:hypothetical protein